MGTADRNNTSVGTGPTDHVDDVRCREGCQASSSGGSREMKLIVAWIIASPFFLCLGLVLGLFYPVFWAFAIIDGEDSREYLPWNLINEMRKGAA